MSHEASPHLRRRHRLSLALRSAVTLGLLAYLLDKAGVTRLGHTLSHSSPAWLAAGLAFGFAGSAAQITQWRGLLHAVGLPRGWWRCARYEYSGNVFDAALPTSIGGDVMRVMFAADRPAERPQTAVSVLLRRVLNFPGLVGLMVVGLLASLPLSYSGRIAPYSLVMSAVGLGIMTVILSRSWARIVVRMLGRRLRRVARVVTEVGDALAQVRGQRRSMAAAGLRGLAFWVLVCLSQGCYMHGVGIRHVPVGYIVCVVTTVNAISLLPISVGGYGVRESAFSAFLTAGALATTAQGVSVGVCLTVQTMILGLIGLPVFLTLRRRGPHGPEPVAAQPQEALEVVG